MPAPGRPWAPQTGRRTNPRRLDGTGENSCRVQGGSRTARQGVSPNEDPFVSECCPRPADPTYVFLAPGSMYPRIENRRVGNGLFAVAHPWAFAGAVVCGPGAGDFLSAWATARKRFCPPDGV